MFTIPLILLVILIIIIVLYSMQNHDIPGPMRIPFIGNLKFCSTKPSDIISVIRYYHGVYGDAYLVYMFNNPHVILSHPKYVAPLLSSTEHISKGQSYDGFKEWLGRGLLTDTGARWKTYRRLLTPAFHFNILQTILQVFLKNEKIFLENLKKHADGRPFDLFPVIALLSLDNVTESIMGVPVNAQSESQSEYVNSINELTRIIALKGQNAIAANDITFKFMEDKKLYDKSLAVVHEATRKVIRLRRKALADQNITSLGNDSDIGIRNKNAFLDLLLLSELDGSRIDDETIREQVDTFMFEGHDTTTSGIVFALYCISKHEDVQQKILDEQKEILNGDLNREPLFAELHQMKYLEMVIKESLRIYPSVPYIERFLTKDFEYFVVLCFKNPQTSLARYFCGKGVLNMEIDGLHIKKNTSVLVNILELQRHPNLFDDPMEFRPERFDSSQPADKNSYSWIAFSAGPRNCIGQKFAMMEMKVVVASVVKHFKLLPVDEEPKLSAEVVLRSQNGVKIRLEQR